MNKDLGKAYDEQEASARLGSYVPNNPVLEARGGGSSFAGARQVARNTLRSAWTVLSLVLESAERTQGY